MAKKHIRDAGETNEGNARVKGRERLASLDYTGKVRGRSPGIKSRVDARGKFS